MNIDNFETPNKHPYGMLDGYNHAYEKERNLVYMLIKCLQEQDIYAKIKFNCNHSDMVNEGLLTDCGDNVYQLTKKSVGLLYSVYGK